MKAKNAYFTVEAAMVLPLVMSVFLFLVYMLFFQYNRCVLEQDMGAIALWGSVLYGDESSLEEQIEKRLEELYREKYVVWEWLSLNVSIKENAVSAEGSGRIVFPLPGWNFWNGENLWETKASYSFHRLSPEAFLRMCRSLKESQSKGNIEE